MGIVCLICINLTITCNVGVSISLNSDVLNYSRKAQLEMKHCSKQFLRKYKQEKSFKGIELTPKLAVTMICIVEYYLM